MVWWITHKDLTKIYLHLDLSVIAKRYHNWNLQLTYRSIEIELLSCKWTVWHACLPCSRARSNWNLSWDSPEEYIQCVDQWRCSIEACTGNKEKRKKNQTNLELCNSSDIWWFISTQLSTERDQGINHFPVSRLSKQIATSCCAL